MFMGTRMPVLKINGSRKEAPPTAGDFQDAVEQFQSRESSTVKTPDGGAGGTALEGQNRIAADSR